MNETPEEMAELQAVLDRSMKSAGPHLRDIIEPERRLDATAVCDLLVGMRLLVLGTVTTDGRPLLGPVDGYFIHGCFWFSSGRASVRMRHLAARPAVSLTYLPGEVTSVTVHGRAELFDVNDPGRPELRQAMLDHYQPVPGPSFGEWLDRIDPIGARVYPDKMFTFHMAGGASA